MATKTAYSIISSCMPMIGMPKDPIQDDILQIAIDAYNYEGERIWMMNVWDNSRTNEFVVTPVDGVITFDISVDIILGIAPENSGDTGSLDYGKFVAPQNEALSIRYGAGIDTNKFVFMPDDPVTGARRIKINDDGLNGIGFSVVAITRFTPVVEDPAYDPTDPSATPTDYRVSVFPLDRAVIAVKDAITDVLRDFIGLNKLNRTMDSINIAVNREQNQQNREKRFMPKSPVFSSRRY